MRSYNPRRHLALGIFWLAFAGAMGTGVLGPHATTPRVISIVAATAAAILQFIRYRRGRAALEG
jgi:hypothetical protein